MKYLFKIIVLIIFCFIVRLLGQESEAKQITKSNEDPLPFFITVYYHIEPNNQLFQSGETGYFETVSSCLRKMSTDLAAINVHATFCFSWLYNDIVLHRNRDPNTGNIRFCFLRSINVCT